MSCPKVISVTNLLVVCILAAPRITHAQDLSSGFAYQIPITADAPSGSVICASGNAYVPCREPYASNLLGVIVDNPAAAIEASDLGDGRFVQTNGTVSVLVASTVERIEIGDPLATSEEAGAVTVATENGYIVGTALQLYTRDNTSGLVEMTYAPRLDANVSQARSNLLNVVLNGFDQSLFAPVQYVQYALAAAIVLTCFAIGLIYFGKSAGKGIEAVGRNPLASSRIYRNLITSIAVTIAIIVVGVIASYFIILL